MNTSLQLDGAVLLRQLRELGEIGADRELGGRTRIALTDDERAGRGGISHNPREHTDDSQLVDGARLLLDVVLDRLAAA